MRLFVGLPLRLYYRVQHRGAKHFPPARQPALLLGNHPSIFDPFTAAIFVKRPICYVVGDDDLRFWAFRSLVNWVKVIPKTKYIPDLVTMRILLKRVKDGEIIGIAPEGGRNWDGETLPLNETLPRLVKKLKIPLICIKQRGSYLTWPRWSPRPRRGKIILDFDYLFESPEDIPEDETDIARIIEDKLVYCELEDPEITRIKYGCSRPAEHLELRLWLCPQCKKFFVLRSRGRELNCTHCDACWEFKGNGDFLLKRWGKYRTAESKNFSRYIDWVRYMDSSTIPLLRDIGKTGKTPLLSIPARMWSGSAEVLRRRSFRFQGEGEAALSTEFRMSFRRSGDESVLLDVPLYDIQGAHIAKNDRFEFFHEGKVYRFTFLGQSAYFWHFLTDKLRENASKSLAL